MNEEDGPARVCFFVNKRLDLARWRFEKHSRDMCSLRIKVGNDDQAEDELIIHNVYNAVQTRQNAGALYQR